MKIGSREYKEWLDSPLTKALKSSFEQSVTDTENQPSQYGTVTLAMYELVCKQRDLAVEALKWLKLIFTDSEMSQERNPELWMPTVEEAIKESEVKE